MTGAEPDQVFRKSRWRMVFAIGASAVFALMGAWLFALPVESYTSRMPPEIIMKGLGAGCVLFAASCSVVGLINIVRPSRLIISSAGVRVDGVLPKALVSWDSVDRFFVKDLQSSRFVSYFEAGGSAGVPGRERSLGGQFEDEGIIVDALNRRLQTHRRSRTEGVTQSAPK